MQKIESDRIKITILDLLNISKTRTDRGTHLISYFLPFMNGENLNITLIWQTRYS